MGCAHAHPPRLGTFHTHTAAATCASLPTPSFFLDTLNVLAGAGHNLRLQRFCGLLQQDVRRDLPSRFFVITVSQSRADWVGGLLGCECGEGRLEPNAGARRSPCRLKSWDAMMAGGSAEGVELDG